MPHSANYNKRILILTALILAAALLLPGCGSNIEPEPSPTATYPVEVPPSSYADGTGLTLSFKLLYAMSGMADNGVLGMTGIQGVLAAVKYGAAGQTAATLSEALGMQDMQPKQINTVALNMIRAVEKLDAGVFTSAWSLVVGNNQPVRESYLTECGQSLGLETIFRQLDNETGNKYIGEWADDNTLGKVKKVSFIYPEASAPFFVSILLADTDWQTALDRGKTRPLPFYYENGDDSAVPTMVCLQNCGIYNGQDGSAAILPTAGDETRLIVMAPPSEMTLTDFIPVAAAHHKEWLEKAEWGKQRVLLPRCELTFEGSILPILQKAGLAGHFTQDSDYSGLGNGLYFADVLHKCAFEMDESGLGDPDPAASYRKGIKDDIPTLAVDRPFILALEVTGTGQVLMMGFVRDPLNTAIK